MKAFFNRKLGRRLKESRKEEGLKANRGLIGLERGSFSLLIFWGNLL